MGKRPLSLAAEAATKAQDSVSAGAADIGERHEARCEWRLLLPISIRGRPVALVSRSRRSLPVIIVPATFRKSPHRVRPGTDV